MFFDACVLVVVVTAPIAAILFFMTFDTGPYK